MKTVYTDTAPSGLLHLSTGEKDVDGRCVATRCATVDNDGLCALYSHRHDVSLGRRWVAGTRSEAKAVRWVAEGVR
jgi:hypothetical protein